MTAVCDRALMTVEAPSPVGGAPSGPTEVLVADDDPVVLRLVEMALRRAGFVVHPAVGGAVAVDLYRRCYPSVAAVLLDVRMPDLDGPHALAEMQQVNPAVHCLFMTGDPGDYPPDALRAAGAIRVLAKPFRSLDELRQAIRDAAAVTAAG